MKNKRLRPARFINSKVIATISISLVLTLLGLIILLILLANTISTDYKESLSFEIFLSDKADEVEVNRLRHFINQSAFTKSAEFISKEDALLIMEKELGANPLDVTGHNPFPASIKVTLNADYSNLDSIALIEGRLNSFSNNIKQIEYQKELVEFINDNIRKVGFVLFSFSILLLVISYALINNTIRLMIYSKRFLINTMKLVGAKNAFIRGPFVRTNILMGIVAAFLAMGIIYLFLNYLSLINMVGLQDILITGISILILGMIIPVLASYFAVNKYLRMKSNDLYYI